MAAAPAKGDVSDTDCSVCHDAFKEPKILACGHVVCRPCLLSWVRTQPQGGCPFCRCAVLEKGGQLGSLEEDVGALPTDLALVELVGTRALLDKDHVCCVCDDVAATALCLHCGDMLCASCTKAHKKMTTTKHHKVEDLSSLTPDSLAARRPSPCSSHPEQSYTLFCPTHGMSVCVVCAAARHRSCPDLRDLGEKAEEARAGLAAMAVSLSANEAQLMEAIQQLERHIKVTGQRVEAAVAHIQETCDRLESGVRSCRSRMAALARDAGSDMERKARAAIATLQRRKAKVTAHTLVVTRAEGSKAHSTVCEMSAVMGSRVQQLDCGVTLPASDALTTLTFSIDKGVVSTVEKALAQLGRVHLAPTHQLAVVAQPDQPAIVAPHHQPAVVAQPHQPAVVAPPHQPAVVAQPHHPVVVAPPHHPAVRQALHFMFDDNHGAGITLSADRRTATHRGGWFGAGLVVSREPLAVNVLYEVRLDEWRAGGGLAVGALTVSPDSVPLTCRMSDDLRPATAVSTEGVKMDGTDGYIRVPVLGSTMKGLRQGQRVGVSLDTSRRLHLHVDGGDQGVWGKPVTGPCYAFIDLRCISQPKARVTALPPTPLAV